MIWILEFKYKKYQESVKEMSNTSKYTKKELK